MADDRHTADDRRDVTLDALRALRDLGVAHTSDDDAAARVGARIDARGRRRPPRRWWRRTARRPLLLALVAVVTTGTAAAAGLGLVGRPSAPLRGPLPQAMRSDRQVAAVGYRISVFPTLTIGQAGWCLTDARMADGRPYGTGSACGPAAPASHPLIAGLTSSIDDSGSDAQVTASIVDARIAGLRLHDGTVVTSRADPSLPDGWRSLVVVQDHARRSRYLGPDGRAARAYYEAPRMRRPTVLPFRTTKPGAAGRVCRLRTADPGVARITSARELVAVPGPTPGYNGRPFLSCATARLTHRGRPYVAAVLVDATDPSSRAARLPGARPRDGSRASVAGDAIRGPIDARRVGHGWLLVQGPDAAVRRSILDALRTG
jgi:hypothetical protein